MDMSWSGAQATAGAHTEQAVVSVVCNVQSPLDLQTHVPCRARISQLHGDSGLAQEIHSEDGGQHESVGRAPHEGMGPRTGSLEGISPLDL